MKKLNLLKPNLVKGFLNQGAGEKVEYLRVPSELTMKALQEDVEAGAVAFKEILENAKKHISRVTLIQSDNREHALMAVNYLAGICNEMAGAKEDFDDFETQVADEYDVDAILKDYDYDFNFDDDDDDEEEDDGDISFWEESCARVPVIPIDQLLQYTNNSEEYFTPNFGYMGQSNMRNKKPYWTQCTKEAICIMVNAPGFVYSLYPRLNMALERFANNKHVFIVVIDNAIYQDMDVFSPSHPYNEQEALEFILDNTADMLQVKAKEEELKPYRLVQFENWAEHLNVSFDKKFPKKEITEKIVSLKSQEKSLMMERVFRYVLKECQKESGDELTKEDFAVLKKFAALATEDKKEKTNAKKLEEELIGMDAVKEQVRNIVTVMKYNKLREKMGIGTACFHNAHLLIGAPGTAKTTVAKLLGAMMFEENLLPGDRFIAVNGADLKGMYVGHSAPKTHQIFENHDVILIDEAYSLTASDGYGGMDSFSQEAIAQLILEIENHPMDKLVMFAGYGGVNVSEKNNKMKEFIDSNPGLKSRINSTIYFDSYTPSQMVEIVHTQAKNQRLVVNEDANEAILEYFATRTEDQNFGNGREARSLLENAMVYAAHRIMSLPKGKKTKKVMCEITKDDIAKAIAHMTDSDKQQIGRRKAKTGFAS